MRRALLTLSLALVVASGGCAIDSNPPPPPTEEESVRALLAGALAPGAIELAYSGDARAPDTPRVVKHALANGDLLAVGGSWFLVRDGAFTRVEGDVWTEAQSSAPHVEVVVPLTDGAFVRRCASTAAVAQVLRGTAFTVLEDPARSCEPPTLFGTSVVPDGYVTLTFADAKTAELRAQRIEGTRTVAVGAPVTKPLAADWDGPTWFGEVADGVIGTAWLKGDPWRWERSDGATRTVAAPWPNGGLVRRVGSKLEVLGRDATDAERWVAWDVDGDGTLADAGIVAPLAGSARSGSGFGEAILTTLEQDPRDPAVTFPASTTMRLEEPGALAMVPIPSTPCVSRDTCRLYGESTLLGVVGPREARFAVYRFWAWRGPQLIYAAPVSGRPLP